MKDHVNDGITENLKWIITGACSQINNSNKGSNGETLTKTSTERWVDVLVHNKKLKGILGYHGQGPSANANNSDYEVIDDFLAYSCDFDGTMEPMNIHDAWIKANAFYSHFMDDTLPCGLIVKENYDQEDLYTSIISNEEVHCDYIYRYTAKLKKLVGNLGVVDYDYELILPTALNAISSYYDISIDDAEEMIDDEVLIIDRETFSAEGSYISNEVEEYIFNISSGNNISSYNVDTDENNRIFIRYNSRTNNVEEF